MASNEITITVNVINNREPLGGWKVGELAVFMASARGKSMVSEIYKAYLHRKKQAQLMGGINSKLNSIINRKTQQHKEMKMKELNKFDFDQAYNLRKPIETLRGIKAKILAYRPELAKPLIVQVGDQVYNYTLEGCRSRNAKSILLDLQMVVPKETKIKVKRFINVSYYGDTKLTKDKCAVYVHTSHENAVASAKVAANVRIIAMPVDVELDTEAIKVYTPEGQLVKYNLNGKHSIEDICRHVQICEGYKL